MKPIRFKLTDPLTETPMNGLEIRTLPPRFPWVWQRQARFVGEGVYEMPLSFVVFDSVSMKTGRSQWPHPVFRAVEGDPTVDGRR
jgi:hypothetical protein